MGITDGIQMAKSKREQRKERLSDWPLDKWKSLDPFLFLEDSHFQRSIGHAHPSTGVIPTEPKSRPEDPQWREGAINLWLSYAESNSLFGSQLDSLLGLRTDTEIREHQAGWATRHHKLSVAAIVISLVALIISGLSLYVSWKRK